MFNDALENDAGLLLVIIFALALGIVPVIGSITVPVLDSAEKAQTKSRGAANVLDVEYDRGTFSVGSTTFKDRKEFASQLQELANGYQSIRFLASGNTTWDEILPILKDMKSSQLPIKCVHKIRKEGS